MENVYNGSYIGIGRPENTESNQCGIEVEKTSIAHHGIWTCTIYNTRNVTFVGSKHVVVRGNNNNDYSYNDKYINNNYSINN